MSDENTILLAFGSLIAVALFSVVMARWRNAKGKTSIYAADSSLEEVGLSALMAMDSGKAKVGIDGRLIMRPSFGTRVIGPVIAAIILAGFDFTPFLTGSFLEDPKLQRWAYILLWGLLTYTGVILNFRQRVVLDGHSITCIGVQMTRQERDLTGLVGIDVHPKRPALVLTFADQPRLYVPNHLSGRDTFVVLMEEIASGNRAAGMNVPPTGFMARAGF